jgi:hypothetical protein
MFLESELRRMSDSIARTTETSAVAAARLPNTAIISPSFLTRAFAVWGHYFVAQLIIAVPIYCIIFLLAMGSGSGY